jgi:hypothetical protein
MSHKPNGDRPMIAVYALIILAANAAANLVIASEGPTAAPYVALGLVALDLVARDALHDHLPPRRRIAFLAGLTLAGAVVSYAVNADAARIALASACAFGAAFMIDGLVYHAARFLPWLERSNLSNAAAAIVDTATFFLVAGFGLGGPAVIQAGMKIAGGLLFALALERLVRVGVYRRRFLDCAS